MLSRTADSLYWIARYMERAENMARILRVADRLTMMPHGVDGADMQEWHSAVVVSGCEETFYAKYSEATAENVISHLAFDPENPSSIRSALEIARRNARQVRVALTTEVWESLNDTWLELPGWTEVRVRGGGLHRFLDWVKGRSLLFHGSTAATMLRRDSYHFTQLGTYIERGDNTSRILDVKYHVLLPEHAEIGGGLDYYQWAAILRSVSGQRSYNVLYKDGIKPWNIARFLILEEQMPRSLVSCMANINQALDRLANEYGQRNESHRLAGQLYSRLKFGKVEDVFSQGLHEFLTDYIEQNHRLAIEVNRSYLI